MQTQRVNTVDRLSATGAARSSQSRQTRKTKKRLMPWLKDDGSKKSTDELKKITGSWGMETWNEYLEYLDLNEAPLKEKLMSDKRKEYFENYEIVESLGSLISDNESGRLEDAIAEAKKVLTVKQKNIVELRYTESRTLKDIAKRLRVSISSVRTQLRRAHTKLKTEMENQLRG